MPGSEVTYEELVDRLNRFTYKPGWRMRLERMATGTPYLLVEFEAENTYRPGETIKVGFREPLPPGSSILFSSPGAFDAWLLSRLDEIERHETREWLKFDGVMIFDPHRNDPR
jgi:hypothetical protein